MPSASATYELVKGDLHRHGTCVTPTRTLGRTSIATAMSTREHGHSHGLVDESIKRSREGLRAVAGALAILILRRRRGGDPRGEARRHPRLPAPPL